MIMLLAETGYRIGEILGVDYTKDIDYENHSVRVYFRDDNENKARAKNAEYRKAKISSSTFQFLMYYLSEYRELLQHQQIASEEYFSSASRSFAAELRDSDER